MFFIIEVLKWIIGIPVLLWIFSSFGRAIDYELNIYENGRVIDYGYDETSKAINN